jgi:Cys-tRNA(Pro)/Cys-tRNA(Cys) deacylase
VTPAIVVAHRANVPFQVHEYGHEPSAASYGMEAAEKLGVDPARVFKTLVASVDGNLVVALVPVEKSLDLKELASTMGCKRASMADVNDAERVTGYVAGGISPLGQRKLLPTVIDESASSFERIYVSAGRRGLQIELRPEDLHRLLHARVARIVREA